MQPQTPPQTDKEKPAKARKPKVKNDPKLIAAAREPRDRWLEKVNGDPSALLWQAKYDVSRALPQIRPMAQVDSIPLALLTAA